MQRIVNHGSFMQALSLKQMIESLGHLVQFVDYEPRPNIHVRSGESSITRYVISWARRRKQFSPLGRVLSQKEEAFNKLSLTAQYSKALETLGIDPFSLNRRPKVDVLVIGSDEVFNCLQYGENVGYTLELFGKGSRSKRLISYAASFGSTTLEGLQKYGVEGEIRDALTHFDAISVRDANSMRVVSSLLGRSPRLNLDPVLVGNLESVEWDPPVVESPYVAVYGYAGRFSEQEGAEINRFAHARGLKTVGVYGAQAFCDKNIVCSPTQILPTLKNARCIVTDTFHGAIFSVILKRDVAIVARGGNASSSMATNSEKLLDLVNRLGIANRLVTGDATLESLFMDPMDFSAVEDLRSEQRDLSLAYLNDQIR